MVTLKTKSWQAEAGQGKTWPGMRELQVRVQTSRSRFCLTGWGRGPITGVAGNEAQRWSYRCWRPAVWLRAEPQSLRTEAAQQDCGRSQVEGWSQLHKGSSAPSDRQTGLVVIQAERAEQDIRQGCVCWNLNRMLLCSQWLLPKML